LTEIRGNSWRGSTGELMNWIDLLALLVVVIWIVRGFIFGFALSLMTLLGVVAGAVCAVFLSPPLADAMMGAIANPSLRLMIAYLLIFLIVVTVFRIIGLLMKEALKKLKLEGVDALLGGIVSGIEGVLLVMALLIVIIQSPWEDGRNAVGRSALGPLSLSAARAIVQRLPAEYGKEISPFLLEPPPVRPSPEVPGEQDTPDGRYA